MRQRILLDIPSQTMTVYDEGELWQKFLVSTATNGVGEESGSFCTPRGEHLIRAKIGAGQPLNAVFVRRRPTGEIYTPELGATHPKRDWILTRILWLAGLEKGYNQGGTCDTQRRFVYIHGTPDSTALGKPGSHGCVRMANADLLILFEWVRVGALVKVVA